METRRLTSQDERATALPHDYLRLVVEALTEHFSAALDTLRRLGHPSAFSAEGALYPNEVCVSISLVSEGQLAATTVRASCDFDLALGAAAVEPLLALSVDAIGSVYAEILSSERLGRRGDGLHRLDDLPATWSPTRVGDKEVFLLVDPTNPHLDRMADEWLAEHDDAAADVAEPDEVPPTKH